MGRKKKHGKAAVEKRKPMSVEEENASEKEAVGKQLPAMAGEVQGCDDEAGEGEDEPDDVDDDNDGGADGEVKWVTHYSSEQGILLVGDGDFSFSLSLARSFRSACNIIATSLDNYSQVTSKYRRAKSNIGRLKKMGAIVLHGIDATQMKHHKDLKMKKFDRIIFNFPHAGFKGKEDDLRLINKHKKLVQGFFRNASHMIRQDGEIHISHKTSFPFCQWKLEELASTSSLVLVQCVDFKIGDYPGYNNKRGDGPRCDQPFPLGECCTYMFQVGKKPVIRRRRPAANGVVFSVPLLQRCSNLVTMGSDGYVLASSDRQRPPSLVPDYYYRMLSYACGRNPTSSSIASGGRIFLGTETHPSRVPYLGGISTSPGLLEGSFHCGSVTSGANLLPLYTSQRQTTAGYRRDVSSWADRQQGTEGGPDCVPDLLVMSSSSSHADLLLHTQRPLPVAGCRRDAWPSEEGFTGRSLLETRRRYHHHLDCATGLLEESSRLQSMIHGGFHEEQLLRQSTGARPGFIGSEELHQYVSEAPGRRTPHGYAAQLQELRSSSWVDWPELERRQLHRRAP